MIDSLSTLSRKLFWLRLPVTIIGFLCLVSALYAIVNSDQGQTGWLLPAILGLVWSVLFISFVTLFRFVPRRTIAGDGLLTRAGRSVKRMLAMALAFVLLLTTTVLAYLSVKLLLL